MPLSRLIARLAHGAALAVLALSVGAAAAQERFPSRPIEVVTHAGVGGGTDITARMMMVHAPQALQTELVVVNRTGGSGAAALSYAASRPRDGHTILLITQTHLLTILQGRGGGVQAADLIGVARATEDPQILMVGRQSPHMDARSFIEGARARAYRFGTTQLAGVDHIAVLQFGQLAGLQRPNVVPFRGGGDIVINLVGGNIDGALVNYAEAESQIRAGDVRALAVLGAERLASLPNVPTGAEIGVNASMSTVRGFAVLRGTPEDRIAALERGLTQAMNGPLYQNYLGTSGQSARSVVGRREWQAQIDEFLRTGDEALRLLGVAR
jgi:tripartite-type tricarboxylate transporter receptor subunit TctC